MSQSAVSGSPLRAKRRVLAFDLRQLKESILVNGRDGASMTTKDEVPCADR